MKIIDIENSSKNEKNNIDQESETFPFNIKHGLKEQKKRKNNFLFYFWIFIILFSIVFFMIDTITNLNSKKNKKNHNINLKINSEEENNQNFDLQNIQNNQINSNEKKLKRDVDEKIGIAFVFSSIFGNGIGRMLSLLANELVKIEKYDIYMITEKGYSLDFKFDKRVMRVPIYGNRTLIKNLDKNSNIVYYILHNEISKEKIFWYRSLNKKVIDVMHGAYLSGVYTNSTGVYAIWKVHNYYDAFINIVVDDYYAYKNLGMNNTFFIPNLFTFNPSITPNSNLTYKNLMVMGRENDGVKGGIYAIKAMSLIAKEVPDSKLYFISSDYRIAFIKDLIKELNITKNIEVLPYVQNISHYFLNSSVLLCPSLSESFPMVMNEGKAHGLPIVAFNVSYSPSYQKGVIVVEMLNYTQMANEAIKLLNNYEYRKQKGLEAKLSLNEYSNNETVNKWDRLFNILDKNDIVAYKKLQNYTYEKYYDEEKARERLESNFNFGIKYNKYFSCHKFNDIINMTYISNIKGCRNLKENK